MANLIIKSSADNLVLQGSDASPAITVAAAGTTTFAENATLSGSANNIGTTTAGTLSSGVTFPSGHILRSFYDESDAALQTFASGSVTEWGEMELTITGGGLATNFLQVTVSINGIYNFAEASGVLWVGVVRSAANGGSFSGAQFGTVESVTRTNYTATTDGLNVDSTITIRAAHPSTSTYYLRPRIQASTTQFNVNQGSGISTITAHEIQG